MENNNGTIIFNYTEMSAAAARLDELAGQYQTAAGTFENRYMEAVANWSGECAAKMDLFMTGSVHKYIAESVPQLITALAELLRANTDEMHGADDEIARNIPA